MGRNGPRKTCTTSIPLQSTLEQRYLEGRWTCASSSNDVEKKERSKDVEMNWRWNGNETSWRGSSKGRKESSNNAWKIWSKNDVGRKEKALQSSK